MENIAILGSTGSIGRNTLDVVGKLSNRFRVVGLAAGSNISCLREQIERFKPKIVSIENKADAEALRKEYGNSSLKITFSLEGAEDVASFEENDIIVSSITGISGLRPTMAAAKTGKKIALANKESMVVAGHLIRNAAEKSQTRIIPVDSEHSGVFQCLAKEERENVNKVTLTASGGPFFRATAEEIKKKTVEEALNHPRWKMGEKVTIDSATLMNKGLELIEARWLFDLRPRQLSILVHPQSIVHSLVELKDGSVLAQLSPTDMRIPIQYALTYPEREEALLPSLDLTGIGTLEFYEVDLEKFPLVQAARQALELGGSLAVALNTANEVAVAAFLKKRIGFSNIAEIVMAIVEAHQPTEVKDIGEILEVDREIKEQTWNLIEQRF